MKGISGPSITIRRTQVSWRHTLGFLILGIAWWWVARQLGPARMPSPYTVGSGLIPYLTESAKIDAQGGGSDGILPHLRASVIRVYLGGAIGVVLGVAVGLLMGWNTWIREVLQGPIEVIRAVPPLALAPFFLIWYGPTARTQYLMIVLYLFLAMVIATVAAIRNVSPVHQRYASTLGGSRAQVYRTVVLPAILPELVGAIRVGIALAWGIAVVAELLGAREGMGNVFSMMLSAQGLDIIMVGIIYVTVVALISDLLFVWISNRLTRWVDRV